MIDIFLSEVVVYLMDDLTPEDKAFSKLVEWYFKMAESTLSITHESARDDLLELKNIKLSYLQGIPFVKNRTKGQKKGFNFRYKWMLESMLKRGENKEALEYARYHLDWIKNNHHRSTYFRHKKEIIILGIDI